MTEHVYLYEPRGYSPGYVYRKFEDAFNQLLKDSGCSSLTELINELEDNDVWHDIEDDYISIDGGARIERIELR